MASRFSSPFISGWKLIKDAEKLAREQEEQEKKEAAAKAAKEHKKYGFISVSVGEGLSTLFKELNVDYIIEGGQTMNPSTEDMLNAIAEVKADTIYIFPNNKNIVLAANQARDLTEDKEIVVVPTKTIPQGITALISFQPEMNGEENLEAMMEAVSMVKTFHNLFCGPYRLHGKSIGSFFCFSLQDLYCQNKQKKFVKHKAFSCHQKFLHIAWKMDS